MKKFELVKDQKTEAFGKTLFRIRSLISFADVEAGEIGGYVEKEENLDQSGDSWVYDNAWVSGNARVYDNAWVCRGRDYIQMGPIGSRDDSITFFRTKELKIMVSVGCFFGDIDRFEEKVKKTHGENDHAKAYMLAAQIARLRIDLTPDEENNEQD